MNAFVIFKGTDNGEGGCCKKYVVLCFLCGGLSVAVGSLFLAVHAVLSAHTASLMHFETVPSYVPGIMVNKKSSYTYLFFLYFYHRLKIDLSFYFLQLILMGLLTMLLARRKLRCGILVRFKKKFSKKNNGSLKGGIF